MFSYHTGHLHVAVVLHAVKVKGHSVSALQFINESIKKLSPLNNLHYFEYRGMMIYF